MHAVLSGGSTIRDMMDEPTADITMDVDMMDIPGGMPVSAPQNDQQQYSHSRAQTALTSISDTVPSVAFNNMSGMGAGPLPTAFGMQSSVASGSTLTEFTKRRNWSKLVLEELKDLFIVLSPDGRLRWTSPSCKMLTGYEPTALVGQFIREFIHQEDKGMFTREFNESIASGNQLRFFYRFRKEDGAYIIFEAFGHPHFSLETINTFNGPPRNCRGVF